jgi:hypothetical protein
MLSAAKIHRHARHTFTDSAPARILPHETASSGRAPESEPSNSWPVFWNRCTSDEDCDRGGMTHNENRIIGPIALVEVFQQGQMMDPER